MFCFGLLKCQTYELTLGNTLTNDQGGITRTGRNMYKRGSVHSPAGLNSHPNPLQKPDSKGNNVPNTSHLDSALPLAPSPAPRAARLSRF